MGNPAWPQGSASTWAPNAQGRLWLYSGEISYADVGVQNGAGTASSGGMIQSLCCNTFHNNKQAVKLWPYHNISGGTQIISRESFHESQFLYDNDAWFNIFDFVNATDVKGFSVSQSTFKNASNRSVISGVTCNDAASYITNCTFENFNNAVLSFFMSGTHSISVVNNTFRKNHFGIVSCGGVAMAVNNNSINIPQYTGVGPSAYPASGVLQVNDQNAGVVMISSTGYNINNNIIKTDASVGPYYYYPYTTGTIEQATGSDPNLVTDNIFTGVGTAMESNFINNDGANHGLQYQCNSDTHVGYDIAVMGRNSIDGGIKRIQATVPSGSSVASLPAGNKFSVQWNIFDQQKPIYYSFYSGSGYAPGSQYPANTFGPVYATSPYSTPANCYAIPSGSVGSYRSSGVSEKDPDMTLSYAIASNNVNYYMTDTLPHSRDSLYYWADQMGTAYGDLLIANLLIEDSLLDSAKQVYNGILDKYTLDDVEANDFRIGAGMIDILINHRINGSSVLDLNKDEAATLQYIEANSSMWAHARAEGWLYVFQGDALNDTLLYPDSSAIDSSVIDTTTEQRKSQAVATNGLGGKISNSVFPNPVYDHLTVLYNASSNKELSIQILDVAGRVLITQSINSGEKNDINMSTLTTGLYLYRVLEGDKPMMNGKITKD